MKTFQHYFRRKQKMSNYHKRGGAENDNRAKFICHICGKTLTRSGKYKHLRDFHK